MKKLIITVACMVSSAFANTNLKGTYDLDVKIGKRNFHDIVEIKNIKKDTVTGNFEALKVFKVPMKGKLENSLLTGSFMAKERGKEFKVHLKMKFANNNCNVSGDLTTGGSVFGVFKGKKRGCHE